MRVLMLALVLACALPLRASCGAASCPIDPRALNQPARGGFTLDLTFEYIDQDQPRIGTRSARVGEIAGGHHDEVRTTNRIATTILGYAPGDRLQLSLAVPFVSRDHFHLGSTHDHARRGRVEPQHNTIPQSWDIDGLGDVTLEARAALGRGTWLIGGIKAPTGRHDLANGEHRVAELPVQPGTGTWDGIAGLAWQGGRPWFASARYQFRTGDVDGYRAGNELQINTGGAFPLGSRVEALLQVNSRWRARDQTTEPEEAELTGGTYVYASPGVRVSADGRGALYALVQIPVYQRVNAIQLTSESNFILGVQTRF
jgi:hypothetical protein